MGNKINGIEMEDLTVPDKCPSANSAEADESSCVRDSNVDEITFFEGTMKPIPAFSGTLEPFMDIARGVNYGLIDAVERDEPEFIEGLIKCGADPNIPTKEGLSPIQFAASNGLLDAVKALIKCGAEVNWKNHLGETALWLAARGGHHEVVEKLALAGGDPNIPCLNRDRYAAIHAAASAGHPKTLKALLLAGADLRMRSSRGLSPLHVATGRAAVELLLAWGGDVNCRSPTGDTPLHCASKRSYEDTLVLLENSAEVNWVNGEGMTPLAMAVWRGNLRVVELLIRFGADANLRIGDIHAPLHTAAQIGNLEMVRLLLEGGADPKTEAKSLRLGTWVHCTPSDVARYMGHQQISRLLMAMEG